MIGRAGRDGVPSDTLLLASPSDAASLRRFAVGDVPGADELRRVYRALRDAAGASTPTTSAHSCPSVTPACSSACSSRPVWSSAASTRAGGCACTCPSLPPTQRERVDALLARARLVAEGRAELVISFAEEPRCRHAQVAAHFGELLEPPCGSCDVCAPRREGFSVPADIVSPLPEDVGEAIVQAVSRLRLAARPAEPARDAARIRERAALRPQLLLVRAPRRCRRQRRPPLDRVTRAGRSARRAGHAGGLPGARGRPHRRAAAHLGQTARRRRRRTLRPAPRLEDRAGACRQRSRVRRVRGRDPARARGRRSRARSTSSPA